ncbi:MAG: sodium:proton antiporter [Candidatus Syntrophonatronum acetioxidans]|uniref:Sodium:proton antiporter n=1 Tax=Candidatus Syntrophonatronum acetioxidans TaxID=1795816 RepID=A0A424YAU7_9FIRM|nr:MAG: sodium:proton antiporter [Candidatus Syntrophonatronum acetioxidans]
MEDIIVRMVGRISVPFIQVYGFYVILHGHLTPGGSFSGGAILGSSMILFALAFNLERGHKKLTHEASTLLECGGASWFAILGLVGVYAGVNFLANQAAGFYMGIPNTLVSAGAIPLITLGLGLKVASTVVTLFYSLAEVEGDSHD